MIYRAYQFDGLTLPTAYGSGGGFDLSGGKVSTDWVTLADGRVWDARRTDRAPTGLSTFGLQCGLEAASESALKTALDSLMAKKGITGTLSRIDAASAQHTLTARMASIEARGSPGHGLRWQPVTLTFETADQCWKGTSRTGSATPIDNNGNVPYTGVVWTITAGAGAPCTAVEFVGVSAAGAVWHWHWTGTIAATKALVIDCGAFTVKNDGANAYSTFVRQSDHNQNEWTGVLPAGLAYVMTLTGAGATHGFASYDGWQA